MRESSHSFPGLNRACVVISSQLYDRRAIDSPLPTLPLLTSLQHLAYLTSTSPRIREILTVDGGLERLISIVGGCLDLAFPSAASTSTTGGGGSNPRKRTRGGNHSNSPHTREQQQQRKRIVPFKPFVAYANGNIEAAQNWIDTSAVLHTYGFALQCLVNVGVRGSEEVRTRVVEAGVLAVVARILSAFLANRQKERERRLALLEPQKSITLWREGTATTTLSGATSADADGTARRTYAHSHRSTHHQSGIAMPHSAPASSSSSTTSYLQSQQQQPQHLPPVSSQQQQQQHIPAQPPTLPPSASRLPSRLLPSSSASSSAASLLLLPSINRTNTPDTVVSVDDLADAESSSGQENELYETDAGQMDIEDETGSATSGEIVSAIAATASGSNAVAAAVARTTNRSRRGTITTATFVSPEEAAEMMVVKLEDEAAARATSPAVEHQQQQEQQELDMTSSMETPVARSISLQPTTHRQHQQPQQEDGDGDVVMSQSHPSLAQLHAASFFGSPTNVNEHHPAGSAAAIDGQVRREGAWESLDRRSPHRQQQHGPPPPAAPTALAAPILPFLRPGASAPETRPAPSMSSTLTVRQSATSLTTSGTPPSPPLTHLFKEDDVLQCLHLLAYLSKYPHVRAVFHDPENETVRPPDVHPCDVGGGAAGVDDNADAVQPAVAAASGSRRAGEHTTTTSSSCPRKKQRCGENGEACSNSCARMYQQHRSSSGAAHPSHSSSSQDRRSQDGDDEHMMDDTAGPSTGAGHRQQYRRQAAAAAVAAIAAQNSDDDEDDCDDHDHHHGHGGTSSYARAQAEAEAAHLRALASIPLKDRKPALEPSRPPRSTANNVFSLVEQFTYRPSGPADRAMRLPTDIQYWAGVIMRNACRKDEQHGGIRQCANMGCGVWEKFPREFAKCRRCRKAKYCSKGCQRRAWQAGHRYWCSARQDSPPQQPNTMNPAQQPNADNVVAVQIANTANGQVMEGVEGEEGIIPTQIRVMEAI